MTRWIRGKLTVTDGTFTGGEDTVALATMGGFANSGAIAITGGRFDGDIILAETSDGGSLKLAGDVVVNGDVINKAKDDVVIAGGTVSGTVVNNGEGKVGITGGTFAHKPDSCTD